LVGVNDAHDYLATRRAMDIVGISEKEQVQPFQRNVLTALLQRNNKHYLLTFSLSLRKLFSEL
jgi:myosin-5